MSFKNWAASQEQKQLQRMIDPAIAKAANAPAAPQPEHAAALIAPAPAPVEPKAD